MNRKSIEIGLRQGINILANDVMFSKLVLEEPARAKEQVNKMFEFIIDCDKIAEQYIKDKSEQDINELKKLNEEIQVNINE